jgi:transposase
MRNIGCDYHPGFQQIAFVDTETGELQERRLQHPEEAEKFYAPRTSSASCSS